MVINFYRTKSWGGMEGRDLEISNWISETAAREAALNDIWNEDYTLYLVTLTITSSGRIIEDEQRLEKIPCGREIETARG